MNLPLEKTFDLGRKKMYEQQRDQILGTQFNVDSLAGAQEQVPHFQLLNKKQLCAVCSAIMACGIRCKKSISYLQRACHW